MCEPKRIGLRLLSLRARRPIRLPAASTLTSSLAARISPITYSRPRASASLYATRLTPPCGFLPTSASALMRSIRRRPFTRSSVTEPRAVATGLGTQASRLLNLRRAAPTSKAGGTPAYPGPVATAPGSVTIVRKELNGIALVAAKNPKLNCRRFIILRRLSADYADYAEVVNGRSFFLESGAYPKCMSVRMSQVKLAHVPRLIGWRHRHRHSMFHCELLCLVDCCRRFQPSAHPNAASFIIAQILRHWTATRSLAVLTKKDLDLS